MNLKKLLATATLAGAIIFPALASAADDDRYFITNKTGLIIKELYVAASKADSWGSSLLGENVLRDGETGEILFHPLDQRCMWAVAIKDETGTELDWDKIDLCQYNKIILKPDGVAEYQ